MIPLGQDFICKKSFLCPLIVHEPKNILTPVRTLNVDAAENAVMLKIVDFKFSNSNFRNNLEFFSKLHNPKLLS